MLQHTSAFLSYLVWDSKTSKIRLHLCSYTKTYRTFGTSVFFGFLARGVAPIAKYQKKTEVPKVYVSLLDRFALCRLRNLPRSQAPASKHRSRNACSGVPGRLGPNPARRRASMGPALRLSGWLAPSSACWVRAATAEVTTPAVRKRDSSVIERDVALAAQPFLAGCGQTRALGGPSEAELWRRIARLALSQSCGQGTQRPRRLLARQCKSMR